MLAHGGKRIGAGRKKGVIKKRLTIWVTLEGEAKLRALAEEFGMDLGKAIERKLEYLK